MGAFDFARRIVAIFAFFWLAACAHGPRPGETFRDCPECPEMVVVPAGNFLASDDRSNEFRLDLINDFAVGRFEVTVEQYEAFARATARPAAEDCVNRIARNLPWRFEQSGNHPVVCVSWHDAQAYVQWLNTRTPGGYRLLRRAEWEYAARAGTVSAYPWGDTASHEHANYGADECCGGLANGLDQWVYTAPVGSFGANAFGLSDMIGNAWEWTEGCGNDYYRSRPIDPLNPCERRWIRGGGWESARGTSQGFDSFPRSPFFLAERWNNLGFRVARELPRSVECYQSVYYRGSERVWEERPDLWEPALCFAQDACLGGASQMRQCFKWALAANAPTIHWADLGFEPVRSTDPSCYVQLDVDGQVGWLREGGREAQCFQQDYCSGGIEMGSDVRRPCFKWALGPQEPALPWSATLTNPTLAEDIPPPQDIYENSFEETSESCDENCEYTARVPAGTLIYERPDTSSPLVGTLSAAECALMIGFTSLSSPHRGVVLETRNEFTAGDVIYELAYAGEGNIHVWRRGEEFEVSGHDVVIRWDPEPETIDPRVGNWIELTRSDGTRGWAKDMENSEQGCTFARQ